MSSATKSARSLPAALARLMSSTKSAKARSRSASKRLAAGKVMREHGGEAAVGGLHGADVFDVAAEPDPGVGVGQGLAGGLGVRGHLGLERGGDEVVAGRVAAVQGADAHAGPAGDLVHRRVEAELGERLPRGGHDALPVAFGIHAQRRPLRVVGARRARSWASQYAEVEATVHLSARLGDNKRRPGSTSFMEVVMRAIVLTEQGASPTLTELPVPAAFADFATGTVGKISVAVNPS